MARAWDYGYFGKVQSGQGYREGAISGCGIPRYVGSLCTGNFCWVSCWVLEEQVGQASVQLQKGTWVDETSEVGEWWHWVLALGLWVW